MARSTPFYKSTHSSVAASSALSPATICSALLMYAPGLVVKIQFEGLYYFLGSVLSATVEGIFLLWFMVWCCNAGLQLYGCAKYFQSKVILLAYLVASIAAGCIIVGFIMSSILADSAFRSVSGNMDPDASQIELGYANAKGYLVSRLAMDPFWTCCSLLFGVSSFMAGLYIYMAPLWLNFLSGRNRFWKPKVLHIYLMGMVCSIMIMEGFYSLVVFAYSSIYLRQIFIADPQGGITHSKAAAGSKLGSKGPNVIFIQHESFSFTEFNTDQGRSAMPYFWGLVQHDSNMYSFENCRSVSGNTIDAMPALLTGCLPFAKEGVEFVQSMGRSIAYDFFAKGYHTASFSSRALDEAFQSGGYRVLLDLFVGGMDVLYEPNSQSMPKENLEGSDDRLMLPNFKEWLQGIRNHSANSPFYAQFYSFNTHYPYMQHKSYRGPDRYCSSMRTVDEFLEGIFNILTEYGQLNNTIILGSGDHGEEVIGGVYARQIGLTSKVLQVPSYIYYPEQLMHDSSVRERLQRNSKKLTSVLDFYPTIQSILHRDTPGNQTTRHESCLTGVDLTTFDIEDSRVSAAFNLASEGSRRPHKFWALVKKGNALYHRRAPHHYKPLGQGKDNSYIMSFGSGCSGRECLANLNDEAKADFKLALANFRNDTSIKDGVKESEFLSFFESIVNS